MSQSPLSNGVFSELKSSPSKYSKFD